METFILKFIVLDIFSVFNAFFSMPSHKTQDLFREKKENENRESVLFEQQVLNLNYL